MGLLGDLLGTITKKAVVTPGLAKTAAIGSGVILSSQPPTKPANGPLSKLDPENNPFSFQQLSYPLTGLGQQYPHYISFYMNVRNRTKYRERILPQTENRESELQKNANRTKGYGNLELPIIGKSVNFKRQTSRTSQSIRLYMPDTMHWTYRNQWRDMSLTDALPLTKQIELGSSIVDAVKNGITSGGGISGVAQKILEGASSSTIALGIETAAGAFGIDSQLAVSSFGFAINPNIDVIYGAPDLRTFVFDFMFAPRNTAEANQVLAIIRAFKFHAAPESAEDSGAGRYWIAPTEFDIEFSVKTMGKISTCVLESVDIDYAPNGWTVYTEQIHEDDMPTNIRMQLSFKELEFITKELVQEGY